MDLRVINGDVLEAKADALIITIDGAKRGMEGNIARVFARRWPEAWEEIEEEITYPLPLGEVFPFEPSSDCPFHILLMASTLNHRDILSEAAKKGIVRSALYNAITEAASYSVKSIATVIMTGGWRLPIQSAFVAMTEGYEIALQAANDINIDIYVMHQNQYEIIQSIALGMGYSRGSR